MTFDSNSELTENQQAMLDLALACDLRASDPAVHPAIKRRHHGIKTKNDAAEYIMEVEKKIHAGRKPVRMKKSAAPPRRYQPK